MKKKIDYYHCIGKKIYENDLYSMVPIRIEDIEKIRLWRNKQTDVLRQKKFISRTDQINYYKKNIFPDFKNKKPKNILFSILVQPRSQSYYSLDEERPFLETQIFAISTICRKFDLIRCCPF